MSVFSERPRWAGLTDVGKVRSANEDAFVVEPPLFAVADGLGGHQAGEVASEVATDALLDAAPKRADAVALGRAVISANRAVIKAARDGRGRSGMGTTMTAVMTQGTRLAVAHVGDSRAYLLHEGVLSRITEDHSLVAEMIRGGEITERESRFHPMRSVITRALGSDARLEVDAFDVQAEQGDRLLLCTDGLHGMLDDDRIQAVLASLTDPGEAARTLIDAANDAGGQDNITVVVVDLAEGEPDARRPSRRMRATLAMLAWVVAALAVVGAGAWGAYAYAQSRAFIAEEGGRVVLYRGLPGEFAGITLHWKVEETDIPVASLRPNDASRVRGGWAVDDIDAGRALLDKYRRDLGGAPESFPATTTQ